MDDRTAALEPAAAAGRGLSRADWAGVADRLLAAVRPFASPRHARIALPGPAGGYGRAVDGLEGFARTLLIAGFRLAGESGADPGNVAEWYADGIAAGVDPRSPERWPGLDEHPQAKVEAAALALVLDLTRPWLWDRLAGRTQQQVVHYLAPAVGDQTYPQINWVWFRLVVQTFLRSVGGPWAREEMLADLRAHDSFARAGGWLADGPERAFDHYNGWALHLYPALWARMAGAEELAAPRRATDVARLDRFLLDAAALLGGDGSPLLQGRSLIYRFAAAAPFWAGALAGVPSTPPGALRRAAGSILRHFLQRGVPDERGLLTLGWHGAWPRLAQAYSGPGSPYWAAKGLLGLALPASHPVWTAAEEPLPIERSDTLIAVNAPGWVVSGTRRDGIVRVVNHGTDHALEGSRGGDSPLYARLGYSTATSPLLDEASWADPLEQSVCLVDRAGRASHRAGLSRLGLQVVSTPAGRVAMAASVAVAHWLHPDASQAGHGSGLTGASTPAGRIFVASLVRGPWEVRLVHLLTLALDRAADAPVRLRLGGWPVAGPAGAVTSTVAGDRCTVRAGRLSSTIAALRPGLRAGAETRTDASPLGDAAAVPWLKLPAAAGVWTAALLELTAHPGPQTVPDAAVGWHPSARTVNVGWPDGLWTSTAVPWPADPTEPVEPPARHPDPQWRAPQGES